MKRILPHIIAVTALLFTFSRMVNAQTATVLGHVKSGFAGDPVSNFSIYIDGSLVTSTDINGYYSISGVSVGTPINVCPGVTSAPYQKIIVASTGINTVDFWINAVTDIDGNSYSAVQIGSQVFMVENLVTNNLNDGTQIQIVNPGDNWSSLITPVYCQPFVPPYPYGNYYNWFAVNTGKICPTGWYVPASYQFSTLTSYLGGINAAGGKLKEAGTLHWANPNTGATNVSGFTAFAGGYMQSGAGGVSASNEYGEFWSSSERSSNTSYVYSMYNNNSSTVLADYSKSELRNVRCVKDSISTIAITNITNTSAQSGGYIVAMGAAVVTGRGICWNTSINPTISNNHTDDGSGLGGFTSLLAGLAPGTTYYVRAYVITGAGTSYGNSISFTTSQEISATVNGTTTVCQNATPPFVTFNGSNGTEPYTFTYTINGGGNQTITTTSGNSVTVSAPTSAAGTYIYNLVSVQDAYSTVTQTGIATVTVAPINIITPSMTGGPTSQTVCVNTPIINITYNTTGATGATFSGLPVGVNGDWAANVVTISGTPSVEGTFDYTVTLTGGCGIVATSGTITIPPFNIFALTSDVSTAHQAVPVNTPIDNIFYVASNIAPYINPSPTLLPLVAVADGLPEGVSGNWVGNALLISGTPTVSGVFNYIVVGIGGCGSGTASGTIVVYPSETVQDGDGNNYHVITIGSQVWMAENLKTTKYINGTSIPLVTENASWSSLTSPGFCWFLNDKDSYGGTYGALYNWYTVDGASNGGNNLCPTGWHVPADAEWTKLTTFLGGEDVAGGKLKEAGTAHWCDPNVGATNEYGFSARAGGFRDLDGICSSNAAYSYLWSSTDNTVVDPASWCIMLSCGMNSVSRQSQYDKRGLSIRCLKNSIPILTTSSVSSVTGIEATCGGTINADGGSAILERGVCWSTAPNPTTDLPTKTSDGLGGKAFSSHITDLLPSTTYHVRAYATNDDGTGYGDETSFTTSSSVTPSLTTLSVTKITSVTAMSGGNITSDGGSSIISRGVCWNIDHNPTIALTTKTVDGAGTGFFASTMTNLLPGTPYYVRSYATNEAGTAYGNEISFATPATITDNDNNTYNTIVFGPQTWMQENLRTTQFADGTPIPDGTTRGDYTIEAAPEYYFSYNNDISNDAVFGKYYTWYTAIDSRNVCPTGWHVPTRAEWSAFAQYLADNGYGFEGGSYVGKAAASTSYWQSDQTPGNVGNDPATNNASGFNGLPGGHRNYGGYVYDIFYGMGLYGRYQSAEEYDEIQAYMGKLDVNLSNLNIWPDSKKHAFNVRCIKGDRPDIKYMPTLITSTATGITNSSVTTGGKVVTNGYAAITDRGVCWNTTGRPTTSDSKLQLGAGANEYSANITSNLNPGTRYYARAYATNSAGLNGYGNEIAFTTDGPNVVRDIEGNIYSTMTIGTQAWMAENLRTTHFYDNMAIPNVIENSSWASLLTPGYCWYNNNREVAMDIYGALYNWYAVNTNKLCPAGWHVPSQDDWSELTTFLAPDAGDKIKEAGESHWFTGNTGTNSSGFNGLPAGYRLGGDERRSGAFNYDGNWWSSTIVASPPETNIAWYASVKYDEHEVTIDKFQGTNGLSVRCIKYNTGPTVVTNTLDNGPGSLRAAIEYSNSNPGTDIITFSIAGTGPFTIQPLTPLPDITGPVVIDGYSQSGASPATVSDQATFQVEIVGTLQPGPATGLVVNSGNSSIQGLSIRKFPTNLTLTEKGNNIIQGNSITDGYVDILVSCPDNLIGGNTPAARNILSSAEHGIKIYNSVSVDEGRNRIMGNYIGVDPTGELPKVNHAAGVSIINSPNNKVGGPTEQERNIISGNINGITISESGATGNRIEGNFIGTNAKGTKSLNNFQGIIVDSPGNFIGGVAPGTGNLISGNVYYAIRLDQMAEGNEIQGNLMGTDHTGHSTIPNVYATLTIHGNNNKIGGLEPGAGNIISGNSAKAIEISGTQGANAEGNKILGNYIGTDISGEAALGNGANGIVILDYANNNLIGGNVPGSGNIIAYNKGSGVVVMGGTQPGTGNSIISNSIYSNTGLGIDLGNDGVTANDNGDADVGTNNLQNYPVLSSVSFSPGNVKITGTFNSKPSQTYTLQFFTSLVADDSKYGEGQTYLGSQTVSTNSNGGATFSLSFPIMGRDGQVITATATDAQGNTSEFSNAAGGQADQELPGGTLHYVYNETGALKITDGTDITAIINAFQTWTNIPTANIRLYNDGPTTTKYADAGDHINLVSFVDDRYDWIPGVLAYSAKLVDMNGNGGKGQILDADIIVNPEFANVLKGTVSDGDVIPTGYYDIQSIITHEIGHNLGLLHSCIVSSTMFYWLKDGTTDKRTLEPDDKVWASYKYPGASYSTSCGTISGDITYGYPPNPKVVGTHITATNVSTGEQFHSYSEENGKYVVPVSAPGQYYIYIEPLDGSVNGFNITPSNISNYIYSNSVYFDYPNEFYNTDESDTDPVDAKNPVTVYTNSETNNINIITNRDIIPPTVVSITPEMTNGVPPVVEILPDIIIKFSEPVDITTFTDASCYLQSGTDTYSGSYTKLGGESDAIIFTPKNPLPYSTAFSLHLLGKDASDGKGITDLKGNSLNTSGLTAYSFTTVEADNVPPAILSTLPANGATGVFVTDKVSVSFSEPMDKTSVQDNFAVTGSGSTLTGSFSWNNELTTVTFTPSKSLSENTTYTLTLSDKLTDLHGIRLGGDNTDNDDNVKTTFSTVAVSKPKITYRGPADKKTGVTVSTPVVVDFTEPINTLTVDVTTFKLLLNGTQVNGSFEFLNDDSRVVFRPAADLAFGKTYTVTLTQSIKDVSDPSQNLDLEGKPTTTFTTAAAPSSPGIYYIDSPSGAHGDEVTVAGEGFDPNPANNTVDFDGVTATVTGATLSSLSVKVPSSSSSSMLNVTVKGVKTASGFFFYVIPDKLDLPANFTTASTNTGSNSRGVRLTTDGTTAYVTNAGSNTVSIIDMATLKQTGTVRVGQMPLKIDLNPACTRAYVTNYGSHTVSVIDLTTKSVKEINVGLNPYGIAATPEGDRVYVANYSSNNLSVIDVNPNSGGFDHVVANVNTGTGNKDLKVTGDAGLALVAGDDGLKIVDIKKKDADYNHVVATANSGTKTKEVNPNGDATLAVVITDEGTMLVIDISPQSDFFGTAVASTGSGSNIKNGKPSGEGLHIFATTENNDILVYEIGTGGAPSSGGSFAGKITLKQVATIPDAGDGDLIFDTRNEKLLAVYSGNGSSNGKLYVTNLLKGLPTPASGICGLIITVQTMINNGSITKLRGIALVVTLNASLRNVNAGRSKLAIADLNTFIALVNTYLKNKQVSTIQGNALVNSANAIINQLKGTKSEEAVSDISQPDDEVNIDLINETKFGTIYPNPTRDAITIDYELCPEDANLGKVMLQVFDVTGRLVSNLVNTNLEAGRYSVTWKGSTDTGIPASRGVYFIRLKAGMKQQVVQVMLIR